jgi:hypothetical protein
MFEITEAGRAYCMTQEFVERLLSFLYDMEKKTPSTGNDENYSRISFFTAVFLTGRGEEFYQDIDLDSNKKRSIEFQQFQRENDEAISEVVDQLQARLRSENEKRLGKVPS